jgi:uncharacterized protein (DUF1800 family)
MPVTADPAVSTADPSPTTSEGGAPTFGRRHLLQRPWAKAAAAVAAVGGATTLAACELTAARFDRNLHLLKRLTHGPTLADRSSIESLGEVGWLAAQADPAGLDTSALDAKLAQLPALSMTPVQLDQNYPDGGSANLAAAQLKLAMAIRMAESPAQLHERLVEFWSDHFNVPTADRNLSLLKIVEDRVTIRPHALGSFRDLLVASAQSPAMLLYLDNAFSFKGKINENYSRELLELHTVGRDGGYDEDDVVALARLLTGWTINSTTYEFEFRAAQHDTAQLSIMGWNRPGGTNYLQHGVDFLHWLADQPATAAFVCTKLARRLVTDFPSQGLVDAMTAAWAANGSSVMPVIQAMIDHPDFDMSANKKFRRPLDYVGAVLRAMGTSVQPTTNVGQLTSIHNYLQALGQVPFEWPAPNGYPDVEGAWLNAGGLLSRWNLTGDIISGLSPAFSIDIADVANPLQGLPAHEIYDGLAQGLLLEPTTLGGRIVLDGATGWAESTVPSVSQFDQAIPLIVITLLTSTDAQYC